MTKHIIIIAAIACVAVVIIVLCTVIRHINNKRYRNLTEEILQRLGLKQWLYLKADDHIIMKSSKGVNNYLPIQYFKDNRDNLQKAERRLADKKRYAGKLNKILTDNEYAQRPMFDKVKQDMRDSISHCDAYEVLVSYVSPAGRKTNKKLIRIYIDDVQRLISDPSTLMTKAEYNQLVKAQNKEQLEQKQHSYYERVNEIIDSANEFKDKLIVQEDRAELDKQISLLFDKVINSIKKIKSMDSEEWEVLDKIITSISSDTQEIIQRSRKIYEYYESPEFSQIKATCASIMDSQREFNEYINEKAQSISRLFGARVVRSETVIDDEYNYVRPYKKTITPFTAEVSAQVFASAENSPIDYIIKYFYPNKDHYPEQIQKLQTLIEELETLKDAKEIIERYKEEYQAYISNVPSDVMKYDEDGFYSRLGFANVSENMMTVEYKFSYTSNGGFAQRTFAIPMTEETIVALINALQNKLTISAFTKEQRALMTNKLRQYIKERDNYTCKLCGNSTHIEPNLLLEIDHIIPVTKGGYTEEGNLQTLCWKCNRSKSDKLA